MPDPILLDRLASGGDAVGRIDGKTVFVPFGAPGDRVHLTAVKDEGRFSRAWIASVETPAPDRVEPPCPVFFRPGAAPDKVCGGCDWQHLAAAAQAKAKRELLVEAFQRVGRIAKPPVEETIPSSAPSGHLPPRGEGKDFPSPLGRPAKAPEAAGTHGRGQGEGIVPGAWRYRNKVQIPVAKTPDGRIVAGFYAPASHAVVPFDDCLVQSERQVAAVRTILEWLNRHPVAVYQSGHGWLRHIYLRENAAGELLAALVARDESFPKAADFTRHLMERIPPVKSIFLNVNPKPGNVVLGPKWIKLAGRPHLDDFLLDLKFRLSPGAFFQVNHAMAEKLYALAVEMAAPDEGDHVLELYAGVGAMGMLLAPRAKRVWSIEENPQAVKDGIESLALNAVTNLRFKIGKCEELLQRGGFRAELSGAPVVALLDPPRAGADPRVLKALLRLSPKRIVYVSCDPATLARDARILSTGGYLLRRSVPVDLFPQTAHVESVNLFHK